MHEHTFNDAATDHAFSDKPGVGTRLRSADDETGKPLKHQASTQQTLSFTTNAKNQTRRESPLDFAFFVHARTTRDILCTYPHLEGHAEEAIYETFQRHHVHVASPIDVRVGSATLHGELIGVPLHPQRYRDQLRSVRESLVAALHYCQTRGAKIVGLGALLPSMTQYGRALIGHSAGVGITTGHSFTAYCIAEHVRQIEASLGSEQSVAVVGAAGSTGQATIKALMQDKIARRLTLVDLPERLRTLTENFRAENGVILISSNLSDIRHSAVVVCVTNSATAILRPEHLSPGCVVIDDAQPENITFETARQRPDVMVIKCLARIPNLECPFDFGLLPNLSDKSDQEIAFTCLAETIALAACNHSGHFTIGSPTTVQIQQIAEMASSHGIGIAPFHSFPEIGSLHRHPRFHRP